MGTTRRRRGGASLCLLIQPLHSMPVPRARKRRDLDISSIAIPRERQPLFVALLLLVLFRTSPNVTPLEFPTFQPVPTHWPVCHQWTSEARGWHNSIRRQLASNPVAALVNDRNPKLGMSPLIRLSFDTSGRLGLGLRISALILRMVRMGLKP